MADTIKVVCEKCGKTYNIPGDRVGQRGKCSCGHIFTVEAPTPAVELIAPGGQPDLAAPTGAEMKRCPSCGAAARGAEKFCWQCGASMSGQRPAPSRPQPSGVGLGYGVSAASLIPAGFWRRAAALIIDGIVLGIALSPLLLPIISQALKNGRESIEPNPALDFVTTLACWLYFALMESSSKQGTLGKMALGLKVTDLDGNPVGFGRATGRHFSKILSGCFCYAGFIMAGFTEKKQGLHDMIAGTMVVMRD